MRSLAELLEVAVRLAPNRVRRHPTSGVEAKVDGDWLMADSENAHKQAHILAAVMEAIEERGWFFRLAGRMFRGGDYTAEVLTGPAFDDRAMADAPSPAHAALAAFVAALEAEAKQ